jgi:carbon monoxide dehydrogenase subunit G
MKVEKCFTVAAPQTRVWEFITSPKDVGPCLPGCESVEILGDGKYKATIKVQVGPIKTKFNVDVETTEERPPEFSAYVTRGEEGGRASRVSADSTLSLKALDEAHTEVTYTSEISVVGRLGKFGLGIMKKKADAMGEEFVAALRERIERSA